MFTDIVFPNNNEKEFINIAEKLNIRSICFIYKSKIPKLNLKTKIKIFKGILTNNPTQKQKKESDLIFIQSHENNQKLLERPDFDTIFNLETQYKKDPHHFRGSGLNQILAKLAAKNKIIITFSFSLLLNSEIIKRTKIIGRIQQNIKLCKKYKVQTAIASFATQPYQLRSESDLKSLALTLGMTPKQAKESLSSTNNRIQFNQKIKSKDYITEGIELVK